MLFWCQKHREKSLTSSKLRPMNLVSLNLLDLVSSQSVLKLCTNSPMIWRHSGLLSEKPIACGCGLLLEETSIPILSEGYLTIFGKIQFPEETTLLGSFFLEPHRIAKPASFHKTRFHCHDLFTLQPLQLRDVKITPFLAQTHFYSNLSQAECQNVSLSQWNLLSNGFSSSMRLKKLADYDETTIQAACLSEYFIRFRF